MEGGSPVGWPVCLLVCVRTHVHMWYGESISSTQLLRRTTSQGKGPALFLYDRHLRRPSAPHCARHAHAVLRQEFKVEAQVAWPGRLSGAGSMGRGPAERLERRAVSLGLCRGRAHGGLQ